MAALGVPDLLLSFLLTNPFADLAGARPTWWRTGRCWRSQGSIP